MPQDIPPQWVIDMPDEGIEELDITYHGENPQIWIDCDDLIEPEVPGRLRLNFKNIRPEDQIPFD